MNTILVVDDEPAIRALVRATLESSGYRLLEAPDGVSALSIAQRERPDLVLLDIALPRVNGLDVCRRLKADPATAHAQVLFLTGLPHHPDQRASQEAGAVDTITKPFSPAALVARVGQALRRPALAPR
ncbi:MAG: response regulator [Dehalococcoidia bacterium]